MRTNGFLTLLTNSSLAFFRVVVAVFVLVMASHAQTTLRLIPYPKTVTIDSGTFTITKGLVFTAPSKSLWLIGPMVRDECARAGLPQPTLAAARGKQWYATLAAAGATIQGFAPLRDKPSPEEYAITVQPDAVSITADDAQGLFYGVQTLCQIIRANRSGDGVPCVRIHDWPCALQWRAYQDDLTRIPSSTFEQLRREIDLGAYFKLNVFTYYMESQFAFKKHPIIGPADGSLTPEELKALVAYAAPRHVNILGNQQSFGHMENILNRDEYKPLAETSWILNPTNEATYAFLDDLYSEITPLLPFPYLNVCCDETQGLGTGPAKAAVEKSSVGEVYAQHLVRLHKLITKKYDKRMMMWGDIVLQHPDTLHVIPKDTIMLTWGYEPLENFDAQILPFTNAGYDFIVCPSVRNYGRILPDFGGAAINIQNFTRDGLKHGALGVINTAWDDGGRTLNAVNWHGIAWGAECAWNGGTTSIDTFNRSIGAVLFGEAEDHFGKAIEALAGVQSLSITAGANDTRFWQDPLAGQLMMARLSDQAVEAGKLREMAETSISEFEACKQSARANADLLDFYLHGVQRYLQLAHVTQYINDAVSTYEFILTRPGQNDRDAVIHCYNLLRQLSRDFRALQATERNLYLRENRPYGVEIRYQWYQGYIDRYSAIADKLEALLPNIEAGNPLPPANDLGLVVNGSAVPN